MHYLCVVKPYADTPVNSTAHVVWQARFQCTVWETKLWFRFWLQYLYAFASVDWVSCALLAFHCKTTPTSTLIAWPDWLLPKSEISCMISKLGMLCRVSQSVIYLAKFSRILLKQADTNLKRPWLRSPASPRTLSFLKSTTIPQCAGLDEKQTGGRMALAAGTWLFQVRRRAALKSLWLMRQHM